MSGNLIVGSVRSVAPPAPSDSKITTVLFGFALMFGGAAFYLIDPGIYLRIMRFWVPEASPAPFIDTAFILGQLECWRKGIDVYISNPCDILERTMVYPPLWLRLWFLPSDPRATMPFGLLLGGGFMMSLAVLPRLTRTRDVLLLWAAVASSAIAFGVERGNIDLVVFILSALAILTMQRSLVVRLAGYGVFAFAALLKLYPIVLLAFIARERRRVAIALGLAALAIGLTSVLLWQTQWLAMFSNVPKPMYSVDGPGARKLPEGLFVIAGLVAQGIWLPPGSHLDDLVSRAAVCTCLFAVILPCALFTALRLARQAAFADAIGRLAPRDTACLTTGALLFCGCFIAGTSFAYRDVLLLFAIPGLLSFQYDKGLPAAVRCIAALTIALMWMIYPASVFDDAFGPLELHGGPPPTFAFWLARELMWWWLFVVLSAGLFCVADRSGILSIGAPEPPVR